MDISKVYSVVKVVQDIVNVIVPVLETMIKRDLNGDGTIGRKLN